MDTQERLLLLFKDNFFLMTRVMSHSNENTFKVIFVCFKSYLRFTLRRLMKVDKNFSYNAVLKTWKWDEGRKTKRRWLKWRRARREDTKWLKISSAVFHAFLSLTTRLDQTRLDQISHISLKQCLPDVSRFGDTRDCCQQYTLEYTENSSRMNWIIRLLFSSDIDVKTCKFQ